jgi:predicted transglutaminase-like cysteine proteinase
MSRSGQAAVVTMEQAQQVGRSQVTHMEGLRGDPMTHQGATTQSPGLEKRTMRHQGEGDVRTKAKVPKAMIEQQINYIATVMEARYGAENAMFKDEHGLTEAVRKDVNKAVKERTEQNLGLVPVGNLPR